MQGNITGLSSGMDWGETVRMLMQIERTPVIQLQQRRSTYQTQLTNWSAIESRIKTLETAALSLDEVSEFLINSTTSSDEDILTVSTNDEAIAGTHDVIINQMARSHVMVHDDGWADSDTTAVNDTGSSQTFSFSYAGDTISVTVPDGTTLNGLVNLINNHEDNGDPDDDTNSGVQASILNDGSGGDSAFHLVLTAKDTGESNAIAIVDTQDNPTDIGGGNGFDANTWETTQSGQNAEIKVDGYPNAGNQWIESAKNEIEDVIPGITLNLKNTSDGEAIRIETVLDKSEIRNAVTNVITAYNELIDHIDSVASYDTETESAGPLFADSLTKSIKRELMSIFSSVIPGTVEGDTYRSLGKVGLSIGTGGKLSLDADEFDDALDDDATAVARLFVFDVWSSSSYVSDVDYSEATVGGEYDFTMTYDADGNLDADGTNTLDGEAGTIHGEAFLAGAEDSNLEGLLLSLANPGDGPATLNGTIKVYTGLSAQLRTKIKNIIDSDEGQLKFTRDRINDTIEGIDKRITSYERRLESIEANYNRRFTQMELLIGQLNAQSNFINV